MMVKEVNELRKKIAEALNGSRLPPVVAALVLDSYRAELQSSWRCRRRQRQ